MEFRIGVNLGDVIEEGERIYGDGVNIAARLEALADPGGICISKTAFDQIETKLPLGYEFLGEQDVKNIPKPVGAYRVLMEPRVTVAEEIEKEKAVPVWRRKAILAGGAALVLVVIALAVWNFYFRPSMEPASVERMAFPLPDKPSIAVLPFVNMSEDPKQEYFSDGLTDQIINSLTKLPHLFVIARISTFTYKGKPVKVQKVAEDLGVRYVLEGSVQRSADRVRITAQLIDAITGHHLWSERYDRELKDIFTLQDEITMKIINALQVELTEGEQVRLWQKRSTKNLKAYLKFLEGQSYQYRQTKEDNTRARQLFEEAIALDPGFANAYVSLGYAHWSDARYGWVESRAKSIKIAFEYAQKAIELDDTLDIAYTLIGGIYLLKRQHEKNIAQAERAFVLNPNGAHNNAFMAGALGCSGRWEESIGYAEKAMRLAPFPPVWFYWILGRSYFMTGQYEKAVETFKKAVHVSPDYLTAHAFLAASLSSLDRRAGAAAEADEVLRINPKFSLDSYAKTIPYKNKADIERYLAALRKAGLPKSPPLPLPDKPSIAVLPFVNMSGDPEQEFFSDGITEEIITALAKTPKMFVIARTSSFKYKGKEVDVRTVGRELGVRYVLEGSVRKSEDQLRITAQLVDAKTGNHFWAERYDRGLKDIFAIQDEITIKIINALKVELTEGETDRFAAKGTHNLMAYLTFFRGREHWRRQTKEGNISARRLMKEAIALDPEFPSPYALLANTHMMDVFFQTTKSPKQSLKRAEQLLQKAIALDDSLAPPHALLGFLYTMLRQHDKGVAEGRRAVALNPNGALEHGYLSGILRYSGRCEEAVQMREKSIRLNPFPHGAYFRGLASAYNCVGRYEEAIAACNKALNLNPNDLLTHIVLTVAYSLSSRGDEARAEAEEVLRINPKYCIRKGKGFYKNPADMERLRSALRKAGLPECPPHRSSK
jgi:adenylate cyclase